MTTTINASTSSGIVATADGSGILKVQSNGVTTNALAWCSFTNSGSAATILNSYNISSVTYTGTGAFTVAFTNAMSNSTYVVVGQSVTYGVTAGILYTGSLSTTGFSIATCQVTTGAPQANLSQNNFAVFGN